MNWNFILHLKRNTCLLALSVAALQLVFILPVAGQAVFKENISLPVAEGAKNLLHPWTGGFNNPQFSAADLDGDGILDLVVFDRAGDKLVTFINKGTANKVDYEHRPEFENNFPIFATDTPRLANWVLMADFNCDGAEDVFMPRIGLVEYFEGYRDSDNHLKFKYKDYLKYKSFNGSPLNIFVSAADIPAIDDINGDGDLDVLTFNQFGYLIDYYENFSQELTGSCGDTIAFEWITDCWGHIFETGITKTIEIKDTCGFLTPKTGIRHSGSTVLTFDEDGDGDKEVVLGDISFSNLNRLINGGNADSAYMASQDTTFPAYDRPVDLPVFPASFYVDVNNDGRKDLLVAPNIANASRNYDCVWYFEDISTTGSIQFEFRTDTFLVDQSLDFGEGAYPVFFDHNVDGRMDIVVGNYGYYVDGINYASQLALLENVGSNTSPAYRLVNRNYANTSSLSLKAIRPAFGDMDNDGDLDMIIGEEAGHLHYFINTAGQGNTASFSLASAFYFSIDPGQYSAPFIYDVDKDGVLDLLVGERDGNINFYRNKGSKTNPSFDPTPTNGRFGEANVKDPGFPDGYSSPLIAPLDSTGYEYLISGSEVGTIKVYDINPDSIFAGTFVQLFDRFSEIDEGKRTSLTIADLDNNNKLEMVVGNIRGGLSFFSQTDSILISARQPSIAVGSTRIYPNPADQFVNVEWNADVAGIGSIVIYDLNGRALLTLSRTLVSGLNHFQLDTAQFPAGVYFCKFSNAGQQAVEKFVIK